MQSTDEMSASRPAKRILHLRVNGIDYELGASPSALLLDVLREDLGLVGTKRGCDMGTCGCCNVLIDGQVQMSCLKLAFDCEAAEITTIEGVTEAAGEALHPLQRAWVENGGSQCGFCTPGFIMTSIDLLGRKPDPSEAEIRDEISGNLCRCTGYKKIVEAIQQAAAELREPKAEEQRT